MTRGVFAEILSLVEAARGFQFTAEEQQVWFSLLNDLDDAHAQRATVEALREVTQRLVPAHIHTRALHISREEQRNRPALLEENKEWEPVLSPSVYAELTSKNVKRIGKIQ